LIVDQDGKGYGERQSSSGSMAIRTPAVPTKCPIRNTRNSGLHCASPDLFG